MLAAQGVKNVRALAGGWNEWVKGGNPVVKGSPAP
jgi:3-mercaptopyruvate sulfurtransferase SseA